MPLKKVLRYATILVGGISTLLGFIGLALLPRDGHLIIGSTLLLVVGSTLLAFAVIPPLAALLKSIYEIQSTLHLIWQHLAAIREDVRSSWGLQAEEYKESVLSRPKYRDPKNLNRYEYRVYSQGGDDGIIEEVFRRIGTTNRYFVEFGSADGIENNTVLLLRQGWSGLWIDGSLENVNKANEHFRPEIKNGKLVVKQTFINAENIKDLFREGRVPEEFDLLSIDIDSNDYHIWEKISRYRPRVVVIEYNGLFPPSISWVLPYNPNAMWDGSTRFSASLKAFEELGAKKGYSLVGCSYHGNNAYFIRNDLLGGHFDKPYTAEHHYEPWRGWSHRRVP